MKHSISALLLSVVAIGGVTSSSANESKWSTGLTIAQLEQGYKGVDTKLYLMPSLNYQDENFSFKDYGFDYKLYKSGPFTFSGVLYPGNTFLDASLSKNIKVRQLDDRKVSYYAGLSVNYYGWLGDLTSTIGHDITGHGQGINGRLDYVYPISLSEKLTLVPMVGVSYKDSDVSNYYYGVQGQQGIDDYQLTSTVDGYVGMALNFRLSSNWELNLAGKYFDAAKEVLDSPLISKQNTTLAVFSVTYHF